MHVAVKNQKYSMIKIVQTDLCKGQIKSLYKGQGGKDTHTKHKAAEKAIASSRNGWEIDLGNVLGRLGEMSSVQGHSAPDETHTLGVVCIDRSLSLRTDPSILTGGLPWGVMG